MSLFHDPRVQLIAAVVLIGALFGVLLHRLMHRFARTLKPTPNDADRRLRADLLRHAIGPLLLLIWYYGLWAVAHVAITSDWVPDRWQWLDTLLWRVSSIGLVVAGLWYFYRVTLAIDRRLQRLATNTRSRVDDVILPLIGTTLRLTVPIFALFLFTRTSHLPGGTLAVANKLLTLALIAAIAWVLRRAIILLDAALLGTAAPTSLAERALFTRVRVLRKIALSLVMVFAVSAVLMSFEEVRDIGKSLLASAGIAGIVIGFAAQRSLGNLFAGLQIALTQPVRIGDQVLVEGDVGNIEEITLTYVVVRVWDNRRIVLPISYFIEKPFQNWTRVATNMLGTVALRFDFSLPVAELRDYLQQEVAKSPKWDKKAFGVQVTNADSASMEVRILASAPDSGASFDLQCELREKAIEFVRSHYPQCLPKQRREQKQTDVWRATVDGDDALREAQVDRPLQRG